MEGAKEFLKIIAEKDLEINRLTAQRDDNLEMAITQLQVNAKQKVVICNLADLLIDAGILDVSNCPYVEFQENGLH